MKSDLVIVYHRQPYEEVRENGKIIYRPHKSPNGIVPTLKSFFGAVNHGAWIAWTQVAPKRREKFDPIVEMSDSYGAYTVSRLPLSAQQVKSFYHITSKEALWPILHSFPERYDYDAADWNTYREVNWLFAQAAAEQANDNAVVWVHDYNLWLVPAYLRRIKPDLRIGFFHHTPFPAANMFNILPWRNEIVESLLSCDVVGFHIARYAANFASCARSLCNAEVVEEAEVDPDLSMRGMALSEPRVPTMIAHGDRRVRVDTCPVGTNASYIRDVAGRPETASLEAKIRSELSGRRLIVSVGRTDYTKGSKVLLLAYERLLERRPELTKKIQLLLTSVSANTSMIVYRNIQREVEALAGRINGRFGALDWQPLLLSTQAIPFEELIAYYRCADICWITPLRDGLNLVAKEYVAARGGEGGALVLSEFTGASVELPHAILTNPYSTKSMDAAIDQALSMPDEERRHRMTAMHHVVRRFDAAHWARHALQQFAMPEVGASVSK